MRKFFPLITFISLLFQPLIAQERQSRLEEFYFGFREFRLKTPVQNYASFHPKKIFIYDLPDIIETYSVSPYKANIGNTKTKELHLFFLGNALVRINAILEDSLSIDYFKKYFGEGYTPSKTRIADQAVFARMKDTDRKIDSQPIWIWKTQSVYMEEQLMYRRIGNETTTQYAIFIYLNDFYDLMKRLFNEDIE